MYNKDEQDLYYRHKFILAIMFDDNYDYYKMNSWLYNIDVLEDFYDIVRSYCERGWLSASVKDNIYKILVDGRNIKDEDYNKRIEIINKIICTLNSSDDNSLEFYVGQLFLRRLDKKELKKYSLDDVKREIPYIHESIFEDFMVALTHSDEILDECFVEKYLKIFSQDKMYYESLNVILKECPSLFIDELFVHRMNSVLEINKELYKDREKINNKIIKRINKTKQKNNLKD